MKPRGINLKMLLGNMKPKIKMGKEIVYFAKLMKLIEQNNESIDYMLGTPIHRNLGDHLITMSEFEYLKRIGYPRTVVEIPSEMFQVYRERLINVIKPDSRIFINGGGWMGNLWSNVELLLQEMVKSFSNNKIIIFPQTIYFDEKTKPFQELITSGNAAFRSCRDLSLFVRDEQSYQFAKNHYEIDKIFLVPDIAVAYYDSYQRKRDYLKSCKAGFCLRKDRELYRDRDNEGLVKKIINNNGLKSSFLTTMSRFRVPSNRRSQAVINRLDEFADHDLIITDRLHGMIFSYITGTPCIAFDNKTLKVSGVYKKWLSDCEYILPLFKKQNELDVQDFISEKAGKKFHGNVIDDKDFSSLREGLLIG